MHSHGCTASSEASISSKQTRHALLVNEHPASLMKGASICAANSDSTDAEWELEARADSGGLLLHDVWLVLVVKKDEPGFHKGQGVRTTRLSVLLCLLYSWCTASLYRASYTG